MQIPMPAALAIFVALGVSPPAAAHEEEPQPGGQERLCDGFGPQAPRDIDRHSGTNQVVFPFAATRERMHLCNLHFHNAAEHRAAAFDVPVEDGPGFRCALSQQLSAAERAPLDGNACKGIEPGDTIEVHWVYTSCDVQPGPGLGSCLSDKCSNPVLRVEAQVFTVVNDEDAPGFDRFATLVQNGGFHQPAALPEGTGAPITFRGSTTGSSYSDAKCSPMQVSWSVRPQCAKLSMASLSRWCADNEFDESTGHGVRPLVTAPSLLSPIRPPGQR